MLSKNILTYSFVSQLWFEERINSSDLFVPLILNLFREETNAQFHKSKHNEIKKKFENKYGIKIPLLALVNILNKAKKNNLILTDDEYLTLNNFEFDKQSLSFDSPNLESRIEELLLNIKDFVSAKHSMEVDIKTIENSLLNFLEINGIFIIDKYVNNKKDSFKIVDDLHLKLADYITSIQREDELKALCDLFIGNVLCDSLQIDINNNLQESNSNNLLKNCSVYIDTPIMIPLLEITDKRYTTAYVEFAEILRDAGANLRIFRHTVEEIEAIIKNAI